VTLIILAALGARLRQIAIANQAARVNRGADNTYFMYATDSPVHVFRTPRRTFGNRSRLTHIRPPYYNTPSEFSRLSGYSFYIRTRTCSIVGQPIPYTVILNRNVCRSRVEKNHFEIDDRSMETKCRVVLVSSRTLRRRDLFEKVGDSITPSCFSRSRERAPL